MERRGEKVPADPSSWGLAEEPSAEPGAMPARSRTPRQPSNLWFPFFLEIIRAGVWQKLSKRAKAVYPVICAFADFKTGECYPSIKTIHKLSGVGRGWVSLALTELIKSGLIRRWSGQRDGESNRYKIIHWGGRSITEQGELQNGASPQHPYREPGTPERSINNIHITTTNITTTSTEKGRRRGGSSPSGVEDLISRMVSELDLKETGQDELYALIDRFTPERVSEACKEAVSQGRPTLKYMGGILKNWESQGRVVRGTRRQLAGALEEERRDSERRGREEEERRRVRRNEAAELAKQKLAECSEEELAGWRAQAAAQAERAHVQAGIFRDSFIESSLLLQVAKKYGIEGL
jgi:DnaD/phage-associated family protein